MKIEKYKPGKRIYPSNNKNNNNYHQYYDWNGKLSYKGYVKNNNYQGYRECYRLWNDKGIKYIL